MIFAPGAILGGMGSAAISVTATAKETRLLATVRRLILKDGSQVDLLKESRLAADADAPWGGTSTAETRLSDVYAVFVPANGSNLTINVAASLGGSFKRDTQSFLVAGIDNQDITTFEKVVHGTTIRRITRVDPFILGITTLFYQIEVDG